MKNRFLQVRVDRKVLDQRVRLGELLPFHAAFFFLLLSLFSTPTWNEPWWMWLRKIELITDSSAVSSVLFLLLFRFLIVSGVDGVSLMTNLWEQFGQQTVFASKQMMNFDGEKHSIGVSSVPSRRKTTQRISSMNWRGISTHLRVDWPSSMVERQPPWSPRKGWSCPVRFRKSRPPASCTVWKRCETSPVDIDWSILSASVVRHWSNLKGNECIGMTIGGFSIVLWTAVEGWGNGFNGWTERNWSNFDLIKTKCNFIL